MKNKNKIYWILGAAMLLFASRCNTSFAGWSTPYRAAVNGNTISSAMSHYGGTNYLFTAYCNTSLTRLYSVYNVFPWKSNQWFNSNSQDTNNGVGGFTATGSRTNWWASAVYYDSLNTDLKYTNLFSSGDSRVVDQDAGDVGWWPSIAFDTSNNSHCSYYDASSSALKYTNYTTIISTIEGQLAGDTVGMMSCIRIGKNDIPFIAYYDNGNKRLKLTWSPWMTKKVLDSNGAVGTYPTMQMNGDTFYIAYYDETNQALKLCSGNTVSTTTITVTSRCIGRTIDMILNTNANPNSNVIYISYVGIDGVMMATSRNNGTKFNTEVIAPVQADFVTLEQVYWGGTNELVMEYTYGNSIFYVEGDITGPVKPVVTLVDAGGSGYTTYQSSFGLLFYSTTSDTQGGVDSTTYSMTSAMTSSTTVDTGTGYYNGGNYWLGTGTGLKRLYVTATDTAINSQNTGPVGTDFIIIDTALPVFSRFSINTDAAYVNTTTLRINITGADYYSDAGQFQTAADTYLGTIENLYISDDGFMIFYTTNYLNKSTYDTQVEWVMTAPGEGPVLLEAYLEDSSPMANWGYWSDDIIVDLTPPSGSVIIKGRNSYFDPAFDGGLYWNQETVTISFYPVDNYVIDSIVLSNYSDFTGAETIDNQNTYTWVTGSAADETRTVWVKYIDGAGNTYFCTDSIVIDTIAPTVLWQVVYDSTPICDPSFPAALHDTMGYTDWDNTIYIDMDGSDVRSNAYYAVSNCDSASWSETVFNTDWFSANFQEGGPNQNGNFALNWGAGAPPLVDGDRTVAFVLADRAGNATIVQDTIVYDAPDPVINSVLINNGAEWTNTSVVQVSYDLSDDRAVMWAVLAETYILPASYQIFQYNSSSVVDTIPYTIETGQGTKTIYIKAFDRAGGGLSSYLSDSIKMDTEPPTGSVAFVGRNFGFDPPSAGGAYWNSNEVTVAFSPVDNFQVDTIVISNYIDFSADVDTISSQPTYPSWMTLPGQGVKTIYVKYIDPCGNVSVGTISDTIIIDTEPPVPVSTTLYDINGAFDPYHPDVSADTPNYTNQETVTVYFSATDNYMIAGWASSNTGTYDDVHNYWLGAGWNPVGDNTMAFNVTYPGIETFPFVQGERRVYTGVMDGAGNTNFSTGDTIIVDVDPPAGCQAVINGGAEYTNDTFFRLNISATDNYAVGWAHATETTAFNPAWYLGNYDTPVVDGETHWLTIISGQGVKTIYVSFADRAGNGGPTYGPCVVSDDIILDTEPPAGSVTIGYTLWRAGYNNNNAVNLTLNAADNLSPIDTMVISNYPDFSDGVTVPFSSPYNGWPTICGQETRTVYVKYYDRPGNVSLVYSDTTYIDTEPPQNISAIPYNLDGRIPPGSPAPFAYSDTLTYINTNVFGIKFTSSDSTGIDYLYVMVNWAEAASWGYWWTPLGDTQTFQLNNEWFQGTKELEYYVYDYAGNFAGWFYNTIILDTEVPVVSQVIINTGDLYTRSSDVNVYYAGTDNYELGWVAVMKDPASGPDTSVEYNDTNSISGECPVSFGEAEGETTILIAFIDRAGNGPYGGPPSTAFNTDTIIIDKTAPYGSYLMLNNGETYVGSSSTTVDFSGTDTWYIQWAYLANDPGLETVGAQLCPWTNSITLNDFAWTLAGVDDQSIYLKYEDGAGNTRVYVDSIIVDVSPPYNDQLVINTDALFTNSSDVYLTTISALDTQSGVNTFVRSLYPDFSSAETFTYIPGMTQDYSLGLPDETRTVYVKFIDLVGNWSTVSDTINVDLTPPFNGSIIINNGLEFTKDNNVVLDISALDSQSGLYQMVISNTSTFESDVETRAYSTATQAWTIYPGEGVRTVYVKFVDNVGNVSGAWADTIFLDQVPPSGTVIINDSDAYTASNTVVLALSALDTSSPMDTIVISNYADFQEANTYTNPESSSLYNSSTVWVTLPGDGTKIVYVKYSDRPGNVSITCTDSIIVDLTPPVGSVSINTDAAFANTFAVVLWLNAVDTQCGVSKVWISNDDFVSSCETYAYSDGSSTKPWRLFGVTDETKTVFVKFFDKVLNNDKFTDTIRVDITRPSGSLLIDNGNEYSNTYTVVLKFSPVETQSGMKEIRVSNDEFWSSYETFTNIETTPWSLYGLGDGVRTVWVRYIDNLNWVSAVITDTIVLDTAPPSGSVSINDGQAFANSNNVTLYLSAADNNKVYNVIVSNDGFATTTSLPYASQVAWTLAPGDETKTVWAKFQDGAGNISDAGNTDAVYIDLAKPSGTIAIDEGGLVKATGVNLTLSGSDTQTPVDTMVISDGANTAVYAFATSHVWTFTGDGNKTVTAMFIDRAGNISEAVLAATLVDLTPPSASVSINEGTVYNGLTINLTLASADTQSAVDTMVISDGTAVSTYAYAAAQAWTFLDDGNKTITVTFIDRAGNISAVVSDTILVDLALPSGTVIISQGHLFNSRTVTLNLSASDTQTSVDTMVISDGTNTNTYAYAASKPWTFPADGPYTVTAKFIDSTGNASLTASDTTIIDITPPTAGVSINQGHLYNGVVVGLTLASADTQVPVDWMVISDGENVNTYAYSAGKTWVFSSDGGKTVTVKFIDRAGNFATASDTTFVDVMRPFGTISIDEGDIYAGGLTVNLTISAADTQSSVDTMVISDGTATATFAYAVSRAWTFAKDGNKSVHARFIDRAGNTSETATDLVLIDLTPPSGSVSFVEGTAFNGLNVNLSISASDTQLGVDTMVLSDGVTTSTEPYATSKAWVFASDGNKALNAKFIDHAGNASGWFTDSIEIDLTPPSGSVAIDQAPLYASRTVSLSLAASDTQTSIDTMVISDGTATSTSAYSATKAWAFASDGDKTVNVRFMDHVGNVSSQFSGSITIDLTPPSGSLDIDEGSLYNGLTVNLTLASADTQSAVTTMMIMDGVDGSTLPFAAAAPWTFASDGNKTVSVRFIDAAGNLSVWYQQTITIDLTPPSGAVSIDEGSLYGGTAVSLTISAFDTQVAVDNMIIADGENTGVFAYAAAHAWVFASDGTKRVGVQFVDHAGNTSGQFTDNIVIDMTPPSGNVSIDQKPLFNNKTVTMVISAVDTQCAIDSMVISDGTNTSTSAYTAAKTWTFASDGNNILGIRFIDHIGNVSGEFTDNILIDLTPPSGTVTITEGDLYNSLNVNLSIAAVDTQSAITSMVVTDGVTTNTLALAPAIAWAFSSDGNRTVSIRFVDLAGNVSGWFSDTTVIDLTPPAGTVTINQGDLLNILTVSLALSASDSQCQIDTMVLDDGTNVNTLPYATLVGWTFLADGIQTINAAFIDRSGNISSVASDTILVDMTPPSGTVVITEGTFVNRMTINMALNAADTQTSVDTMVLSDGMFTNTCAYAASKAWTFTYDGNRTMQVWFIDHAGNISAQAIDNILIDMAKPSAAVSIDQGAEYNGLTVNLSLASADTESAVDTMVITDGVNTSTSAYMAATPWTFVTDGIKTVTARFIDRPGNISIPASDTILIDITPPSGSVVINGGDGFTDTWAASTVTLSASDTLSSVDTMVISEGGVTNTYAYAAGDAVLDLSAGDGLKTVSVTYIDRLGNSAVFSGNITVDVTPPSGTVAVNGGYGYVNGFGTVLNFSAVDTQSGITQVMLSNDNFNFVTVAYAPAVPWILDSSGDGEKYVYAILIDALGHAASLVSDTVVVDLAKPYGTIRINSGDNYTNTFSVNIVYSASDTQSGPSKIVVSNDSFTTYNTFTYVPPSPSLSWMLAQNMDSVKPVWAKFIDGSGNVSAVVSDTIMISGIALWGVSTAPNTEPSNADTWSISLNVQNIGMKNLVIDTVTSYVVFTLDGQDVSSEFAYAKPSALTLAPGNIAGPVFNITRTTAKTGRLVADVFVGSRDDRGPALGVHITKTIQIVSPANSDRSYTLADGSGDTLVDVYIPAGSLTEDAKILIAFAPVSDSITEANSVALDDGQLAGVSILAGRIFSIRAAKVNDTSTDVTINDTSMIRLTISYAGVWLGSLDPANLRIFVLDGRAWRLVSSTVTVDPVNKTVSVFVNHFSVYRLMIFKPYTAASSLDVVRVFPNPFKVAEAVNNKVKFGMLTSDAVIRIYNVAGELVKEITVFEGPPANGIMAWDGKNAAGNDVAPGIYIYVVTNNSGERASGKIGLIR